MYSIFYLKQLKSAIKFSVGKLLFYLKQFTRLQVRNEVRWRTGQVWRPLVRT